MESIPRSDSSPISMVRISTGYPVFSPTTPSRSPLKSTPVATASGISLVKEDSMVADCGTDEPGEGVAGACAWVTGTGDGVGIEGSSTRA